MKGLNYNKRLILCGVLFTLHNIEESVGYAHFTFPPEIKLPFTPPSAHPMVASIIVITIITWIIILLAISSHRENLKRDVVTILVTVFLINALFPHIISAIFLRKYTPAVVTSVLLYLPFSAIMLPRLYRTFHPRRNYFKLVAVWILISLLLTIGLQLIMKLIFQ
jgi:hypothetical protein